MSAYGEAVLLNEEAKVREAPDGGRNDTLVTAAYRVGRVVDACGLDPDEVTDMLVQAAYVAYFTTSDEVSIGLREEVRRTVASGLRRGMLNPKEVGRDIRSQEDGVEDVLSRIGTFLSEPRGGHAANRMHPVMLALGLLGVMNGGPRDIRAPMRKVRIIAGVGGLTTVVKAIGDLEAGGYIKVNTRGDSTRGTTYDLLHKEGVRYGNTPTHNPDMQMRSVLAMNSHDAFNRRALGRAGQRITTYLADNLDQWITQAGLAREIGVSPSTVTRHVQPDRPLIAMGLIERGPDGQVRMLNPVDEDELDRVAFACRTMGIGDRRRRRTARYYVENGYLTDDLYWVNQSTGDVTGYRAWWLEPTTVAAGVSPSRPPTPAAPIAFKAEAVE